MSEVYRKTSAEELTAMADELRAIGPFEEDETFYFATEADLPEQNFGVTKLMPKYGSTTVIERDGVCESWVIVDKEDYPYGVTKMRRPNYESYRDNTSEEPEKLTFYIYGLDLGLEHDGETTFDLNDYIEVLNGYYTFENTDGVNSSVDVGTGSIIKVYNEEDVMVEKFVVVIYGDLNYDGLIGIEDSTQLTLEMNTGDWSVNNIINYMVKAADIDQSGSFDNSDVSRFSLYFANLRIIDQVRGRTYEEAKINIYYPNIIGKLSFEQAYSMAIDVFYQKAFSGALTQKDVNNIVFDENAPNFFRLNKDISTSWENRSQHYPHTFLDIKKINVTANWLKAIPRQSGSSIYYRPRGTNRLYNLEEVNITDFENVTEISSSCFWLSPIKTIKCSPTKLNLYSFCRCKNLTFGPNSLSFDKCINYQNACLSGCNLESITIIEGCTTIGGSAFYQNENLVSVYLPDTPPTLENVSAFSDTNQNLKFYVNPGEGGAGHENDIKDRYAAAENWSDLISKFEVITL